MKTNRLNYIVGFLIVACLMASLSVAQQKIADDDLLKMLDNANSKMSETQGSPEKPAEPVEEINPVDQAESTVQEATPVVEDTVEDEAVEDEAVEDEAVEDEAVEDEAVEDEAVEDEAVEDVAVEEAIEDVAVEEAIETPVEGMIDDLGMVSFDEATASRNDELISVRLNKVGLEEAINLFAQLSGANIIVPELTEAAQISVNLKDVEWRPALQSILDSYNYELYQKVSGSNVFSVRRRPAGAPEPQVVETFLLRYATVPNAAALVRELLPEDAKISEFASRNMLVVKSTESSLSEVRSVLATIDSIRQQVFIESKFMELTDKAQKDLGVDWAMLQGYDVQAANLSSILRNDDTDTTATERSYNMAGGQVEAAGSPEFVEEGAGSGTYERYQEIVPSVVKSSEEIASQLSTAVLTADDLKIVLSALEQSSGVNLVSNPKVIVANEEEANISIIRKEPNIKQERQQSAAGDNILDNVTYELDPDMPFFEYGIKLDVTPSINTSSNITVKINPSLTRWVADKEVGENSFPYIDEKSIKTVFNLSSGQTAAIGGLTEVTDSDIERKVPLLGSIPFLGRLFSWEQTISDQRETIIFVTVGLANTHEIGIETGIPEDSELARRRLIRDSHDRILREQRRIYLESEEGDKLEDMIQSLDDQEARRQEQRAKKMENEQEKSSKNEVASK